MSGAVNFPPTVDWKDLCMEGSFSMSRLNFSLLFMYVLFDLLQCDSEIQYYQVMTTSHVCLWEGPCLGCADPRSETVLYHDVIDLAMCSVWRITSPAQRILVLAKGI